MKMKLVSLGLLALAPLAAQAELVEMQDTELADVKGQQAFLGGFSWSGNVDFTANWSGIVAGYAIQKEVYAGGTSGTDWEVGGSRDVTSPYSGRWYNKSVAVGNDAGTKYIAPRFSWGR
ncbi:MAG: hypothetical protein SVO96_01500 [Pseudomonadota bacterium]|nr:hypothetical protein [Pseudomonadota bacterium]